ncbi:MAG: toprim domain-containing protein [Candidatus Wallbacteria bacterium]|nr:toprim domain-containing protein [Candidatus Wallbacteria bacterium]
MPRIPDDELARLKADVSLEQLARARGIPLTRHGKDLRGLCPFHEDHEPSLVIDTDKNLWHCFGACSSGGDVIAWLQRVEGVSFRHAVELLRGDLPGLAAAADRPPVKRSTVRRLPPAVSLEASALELLDQVVNFYHRKLLENPRALAYLDSRGLGSREMIAHFRLGLADRTLGLTLPEKNRDAGATLRARLVGLGVLKPTGHERFHGCITAPLTDDDGHPRALYGRRIVPNSRTAGAAHPEEAIKHLYMPGPHSALFNAAALKASDEIILCESPFDALTFWANGFRNVTTAYGVNGFTDLHREAFRRFNTRRVLIAYDNDDAGNAAARKLARELIAAGLECYRIRFPRGMDANEFAAKVKPAAKSLGLAIRKAEWLGKGSAPTQQTPAAAPAPAVPPAPEAPGSAADTLEPRWASELPGQLSLFAARPADPAPPELSAVESPDLPPASSPPFAANAPTQATPAAPAAKEELVPLAPALDQASEDPDTPLTSEATREPPAASPLPPPPAPPLFPLLDVSTDSASLSRGDRHYRVRGLAQLSSLASLRVNLRVRSDAGFHVDTLDLLQARQRVAFEKAAALELGVTDSVIHHDLGDLLNALDELVDERLRKALAPPAPAPTMTDAERADALALLRDPRLVDRILADFDRSGVAGERVNKLVGYLATLSRKLKKPLALILQSSSAAGKSTLMDLILSFVPPEDREQFSALTGQALFYMGETNLAHKILAITEEEGAERASYALKLLQSEGQLTIASTGKDPATGKLVTHNYKVEGPVMIFLTTTASDLDDELQNRCLVLSVDEDRSQTQRIHHLQRAAHTLEGLVADTEKDSLLALHQNAQRLLAPLAVENPFVHLLAFPDDKTRTRRDHAKYLNLIDTVALLHQHQRPIRSHTTPSGKTLRYLQVTPDDIRLANRLADEVLGRSLDELPPQTRRLLGILDAMVSQACDHQDCSRVGFRFTRRQLREFSGWGNTQLKLHLARLEDFEYLATHRSGHGLSFDYELLYDGRGTDGRPFLAGLIDPDALPPDTATTPRWSGQTAGWSGSEPERSGSGRPQVGPVSGGGRPHENPHPERHIGENSSIPPENAHLEGIEKNQPYPQPRRTRPPAGGNGSSHPDAQQKAG